jgi:hypothetical protein
VYALEAQAIIRRMMQHEQQQAAGSHVRAVRGQQRL